jgi:hypothetical protein
MAARQHISSQVTCKSTRLTVPACIHSSRTNTQPLNLPQFPRLPRRAYLHRLVSIHSQSNLLSDAASRNQPHVRTIPPLPTCPLHRANFAGPTGHVRREGDSNYAMRRTRCYLDDSLARLVIIGLLREE